MVSNVLKMTSQQLVETLARFRVQYADDAEYQELRARFPEDWPM
jgi:hypothetical protein